MVQLVHVEYQPEHLALAAWVVQLVHVEYQPEHLALAAWVVQLVRVEYQAEDLALSTVSNSHMEPPHCDSPTPLVFSFYNNIIMYIHVQCTYYCLYCVVVCIFIQWSKHILICPSLAFSLTTYNRVLWVRVPPEAAHFP